MYIDDGKGGGNVAEVTSDNKLSVDAIQNDFNHFANQKGDSFIVYSDITPTGAGDQFMYIKNDSTKDMVITWYRAWTASGNPEAIDIYANMVGTPGGTTALTPGNLNLGSAKAATGEFYEGVDLTGLSGGVLLDRLRVLGGEDVFDKWEGGIILPKGTNIVAQALSGSIAIELTFGFYYE